MSETDLHGVGREFEVELGSDERLGLVRHDTGKREPFRKAHADAAAEQAVGLSNRLARTAGSVLEGLVISAAGD